MPIIFNCACGKQLQAADEYAGRLTQCPSCGRQATIPSQGEATLQVPSTDEPPPRRSRSRREEWEDRLDDEDRGPPVQSSGKATASCILGILSLCIGGVLSGLPAIILVLAHGDIKRSRGRMSGSGMATTGIVTGILGCVMTVVAIFLIIPAIQRVRGAATRVLSGSNMKQIGSALHNYHGDFGFFPYHAIHSKDGKPLLSWRVAILEYLGEGQLYRQFRLDEPWDSPHNKALLKQIPKVYRPVDERGDTVSGNTHYLAFVGPGTVFPPRAGKPQDGMGGEVRLPLIVNADGTSQTIMVVEVDEAIPWTKPDDLPYSPDRPLPNLGEVHPPGFLALMADGSVKTIPKDADERNIRAMITWNGKERIDPDLLK